MNPTETKWQWAAMIRQSVQILGPGFLVGPLAGINIQCKPTTRTPGGPIQPVEPLRQCPRVMVKRRPSNLGVHQRWAVPDGPDSDSDSTLAF